MDAIQKALKKLAEKEREHIKKILEKLAAGEAQGLDVKKLKGREDIFRVRKGDFRIIYRKKGQRIFVILIERRSDKTYRSL